MCDPGRRAAVSAGRRSSALRPSVCPRRHPTSGGCRGGRRWCPWERAFPASRPVRISVAFRISASVRLRRSRCPVVAVVSPSCSDPRLTGLRVLVSDQAPLPGEGSHDPGDDLVPRHQAIGFGGIERIASPVGVLPLSTGRATGGSSLRRAGPRRPTPLRSSASLFRFRFRVGRAAVRHEATSAEEARRIRIPGALGRTRALRDRPVGGGGGSRQGGRAARRRAGPISARLLRYPADRWEGERRPSPRNRR